MWADHRPLTPVQIGLKGTAESVSLEKCKLPLFQDFLNHNLTDITEGSLKLAAVLTKYNAH